MFAKLAMVFWLVLQFDLSHINASFIRALIRADIYHIYSSIMRKILYQKHQRKVRCAL